jgi:hypothetical protein
MANFKLRTERRGDCDMIFAAGALDESAGPGLIALEAAVGGKCVFNFAELTQINSRGVSAWLTFIRGFRANRQVAMEECPHVLVMQINMIPSFAQGTEIRSVYAPFRCAVCNLGTRKLVPTGADVKSPVLPVVICEKCRAPMELEDDPDDFFDFFKRRS